jgi:hypothetical protein
MDRLRFRLFGVTVAPILLAATAQQAKEFALSSNFPQIPPTDLVRVFR